MPTITLSISEDLKKDMNKNRFINWSEVAREAIREKVSELKLFKSIVAKSKLTEIDADEIADKINRSMHNRYKKNLKDMI